MTRRMRHTGVDGLPHRLKELIGELSLEEDAELRFGHEAITVLIDLSHQGLYLATLLIIL